MTPFQVDRNWYQDTWYDAAEPPRAGRAMRRIVLFLTIIAASSSGLAMAQHRPAQMIALNLGSLRF
jgi:hypothetical protein